MRIFVSPLFLRCNDMLKNRDDSQSNLSTRLTAIKVLGTMYERLGRMTGRSFEETIGLLNKGWKSAESTSRTETMIALGTTHSCPAFLVTRYFLPILYIFFSLKVKYARD